MQSKMDFRKFLAVAAVSALGATAIGQVNAQVPPASSSTPAPEMTTPPSDEYGKLDKDKDGAISKREARKNKELSKQWSSLDANKDGKLDSAEFAQFEAKPSSSEPATTQPEPAKEAAPPVM